MPMEVVHMRRMRMGVLERLMLVRVGMRPARRVVGAVRMLIAGVMRMRAYVQRCFLNVRMLMPFRSGVHRGL